MATYKVIQDIEAEDKLIGPFGIRQFIYLMIVAVSLFIGFRLAVIAWFLAIPLIPHTLFFSLLSLPFGGEQPTETWLLAKIRFAIKPRIRIWNQSGVQDLVTINAVVKMEKNFTNNMTQGEVQSRLEALANTIDSRGWAIKNVNVNMFNQPAFAAAGPGSDRLLDVSAVDQSAPVDEVPAAHDILDEQNNPTAQNLDRMISASSKANRERLISNMKHPQPSNVQLPAPSAQPTQRSTNNPSVQPDYWFLGSGGAQTQLPGAAPVQSNVFIPDPAAPQEPPGLALRPLAPSSDPISEEELLDKIHADKEKAPKNYGNMRVIKTLEEQQEEARAAAEAEAVARATAIEQPVTPAPDPDIIELANNDDLNVATIARQAHKKQEQDLADGEVVINLH